MTRPAVVRVHPYDRFRVRANRKLRIGPGAVSFPRRSRFYHCPVCARKTLVRYRQLDVFEPPPSPFPTPLKRLFDSVEVGHHRAFDFHCGGCARPVRLLYWEQERGMGGWWYSYVTAVLELDGPEPTEQPAQSPRPS